MGARRSDNPPHMKEISTPTAILILT